MLGTTYPCGSRRAPPDVTELMNAQAALASLPRPASSAALANSIGISRWAWDLIMGSLRGPCRVRRIDCLRASGPSASKYNPPSTRHHARYAAGQGRNASSRVSASTPASSAGPQAVAFVAAGYHCAPCEQAGARLPVSPDHPSPGSGRYSVPASAPCELLSRATPSDNPSHERLSRQLHHPVRRGLPGDRTAQAPALQRLPWPRGQSPRILALNRVLNYGVATH
jgi:hypothetical protein